MMPEPERLPTAREQRAIQLARDLYARNSNDDVEIDDIPWTSPAGDGIWVAAWVFVHNDDIDDVEEINER